MTYTTYLPSLLRGPLAGSWGSRWLGAVDALLDSAIEGVLDAGTLSGLTTVVGLLGYPTVEIRTARDFGRLLWAQWFVVAYGTGIGPRAWGSPDTWGTVHSMILAASLIALRA